jgi:hypothetical protein
MLGRRRLLFLFVGISAVLLPSVAIASSCNNAYVTNVGSHWLVAPSGSNDTANLQCALNEAAAQGPGAVVNLSAGQFTTGFIRVVGFDGTLRGAGTDVTTVGAAAGPLACQEEVNQERMPILMTFQGGYLRIADFTLESQSQTPCDPYGYGVGEPIPNRVFEGLLALTTTQLDSDVPVVEKVSGRIDHMRFRGPRPLNNIGEGVRHAFLFGGGLMVRSFYIPPVYTSGDLVVANSLFQGMNGGGVLIRSLNGSSVTIGGNPSSRNDFLAVSAGLFGFIAVENATVNFSYNNVEIDPVMSDEWPTSGTGALIQQASSTPTNYVITHNRISTKAWADAVGINDFTGASMARVLVSNNDFELDSYGTSGGIYGLGTNAAVITNNRFKGTAGFAGIYLGFGPWFGITESDENWVIKGNDLEQLEVLDGMPLILGPTANYCTVVGGHNPDDIWDFGIGNRLTGVNNMNGQPPGPAIKEAMKRKADVMKWTRVP